MITSGKPYSGVHVHAESLAKELTKMGHHVRSTPASAGSYSFLHYLRRIDAGADLIHVHVPNEGSVMTSVVLGRLYRQPVVCTFHNPPNWYRSRLRRHAMRVALGRTGGSVTVSDYVRRTIPRSLPASPPAVTIFNGVDTKRFDPGVSDEVSRESFGVGSADLVLLFVGRLVYTKGVTFLVEAVSRLREQGIDAALLVCGTGKYRPELEQKVRALGLDKHVKMLGFVPQGELRRCYAASDVCVVPSTFESMSIVTLEAMSMRKPVVATRVGGIPELVRDGENGLVVPSADSRALAEAIRKLHSDRNLASRLAQAGRLKVEENFTWGRVAGKVLEVYRNALENYPA